MKSSWGVLGVLLVLWAGRGGAEEIPEARRGMVATVQPVATQAGLDALKAGGNAVDAAIACALTLGVVDGHNSGIGGGCFMTLRLADGRLLALDGRETAPAAATRDMFLREGKADPALSVDGALAVGVPGEPALLAYASTNFGKLPLSRLLEAAARVASSGFALDRHYASRLDATRPELARFPASRTIFLRADGTPWRAGERLVQTDLGASYRAMAEAGVDWFYRGPFAAATASWMQSHGGILTAADFAGYRIRVREPVRGTYRGWEIISFPPPSSGGVHVLEILNILENFDMKALGDRSPEFVHMVTEAMKLAFADRARWLGDPDFTPVPRGLIDKGYATELARGIQRDRTTPVSGAGTPPRAATDTFPREVGRHTTHFSTADAEGNWVACTASLNTSFGSKVVIPGTGILLNNHMDDFSVQAGVPNSFGLVGAEANAVEAGKRPLSSMSPTILLRDGRPVLSVGAAGGPTIITQTVLAILRTIDFGQDPRTALAGPRFHHQWRPDELHVEAAWGDAVVAELRKRGHVVVVDRSLGAAQAVGVGPAGSGFRGSADPRGEGSAAGW
ncbi:MAG: gamma-glutamyltransferase [Verrucomicrobiales bacterium]|nr:gamma-glutamyltransferase [Verrucomicrobiales bacterium]